MIFKAQTKVRVFIFLLCALLAAAVALRAGWDAEAAGEAPSLETVNDNSPQSGRIPFPKPDTHRGNWLQYHGASVPLSVNEAGQQGTGCLACHHRNDCVECHNTRPPRDHNNFWRTRSHGLAAGADRERCRRCHLEDYCVRCHDETAPRSHTGSWLSRHCSWCHFGTGLAPADNCVVCHRLAPHTSAPHGVNPAADCSLCHT